MIYGQGLYAEDEFIEVDVTNEYDLTYNIYKESELSYETFSWYFYKREDIEDQFQIVSNGKVNSGILRINFNDYGLQFSDYNFLIRIVRDNNDVVIVNNSFWYYYRIYTKEPLRTPWYVGNVSIESSSGGGGGVAVMPVVKEKDIPTILINKIREEENEIDIKILNFIENDS